MAYWSQTDLENRLSPQIVKQILDDDNDGFADVGAVARLQADSDSKVESYLRPIYDLTVVRATPPNEVKRLSLDVAVAMAAMRHPEVRRTDGPELMSMAERDLERLRTGKTRLDVVGSPEPAANVGGTVVVPPARADEEHVQLWSFGETGDF